MNPKKPFHYPLKRAEKLHANVQLFDRIHKKFTNKVFAKIMSRILDNIPSILYDKNRPKAMELFQKASLLF